MTYMVYASSKIILPTLSDNNYIFDRGTTGHFIQAWKLTTPLISVTLIDVSQIKSTHTAILVLQNLLEVA